MLTLRHARLADAELLCEAERAIVRAGGYFISEPDELQPANVQERIELLANGCGLYLVAEEGGVPIGHGSLVPMPMRKLAHIVSLDLCVHLGHQGRGVGRALLAALVAWAQARPEVRKIELRVRAPNTAAIALYRSLGFVEEGCQREHVRLCDGSFVDDLCMALMTTE